MDQENTDVPTILQIPADVARYGSAFFLQQCWCWGQDIKRAEGNLLLEYGFARERPPEGVEGCTCYFLRLDRGESLLLWNFGLFYLDTEVGGMFLLRSAFMPKLVPTLSIPRNIWLVADLPPAAPPATVVEGERARTLLSAAFLWISSYERWVKSTVGDAHRLRCLENRSEPIVPSEGFAAEWERLAKLCLNFVVGHNELKSDVVVRS